jgi:hypothetical protein
LTRYGTKETDKVLEEGLQDFTEGLSWLAAE